MLSWLRQTYWKRQIKGLYNPCGCLSIRFDATQGSYHVVHWGWGRLRTASKLTCSISSHPPPIPSMGSFQRSPADRWSQHNIQCRSKALRLPPPRAAPAAQQQQKLLVSKNWSDLSDATAKATYCQQQQTWKRRATGQNEAPGEYSTICKAATRLSSIG